MKFRAQLAAWQSSLAEAHTQDLRWHEYDRVLEMALGRASRVVIPKFNQQLAMYQESLNDCAVQDADWMMHDDVWYRIRQHIEYNQAVAWSHMQAWRLAIHVACPSCGSQDGEFCTNKSSGRQRGQRNFLPHAERKKAAIKNRSLVWDRMHGHWEEPDVPEIEVEPDEEEETFVVGSPEEKEFTRKLELARRQKKAKWEAIRKARQSN